MDQYLQTLTRYWGYTGFRTIQRDIIESIEQGKDTIALMPTGGGKSITFQVPGMTKEGVTLVITPLIALMKDQVQQLNDIDIPAVSIHAGMSQYEIKSLLNKCIHGDIKFLYCSPERIRTPLFLNRVEKIPFNLIAIDEAHCISEWGHDFRPSYLLIADIRDKLRQNVPFLALTATATKDVVQDISSRLGFQDFNLIKMSFKRENLTYTVLHTENKLGDIGKIIKAQKGTGIIYLRSRKKTEELTRILRKYQVSCDYYHAGLSMEIREKRQADWQNNQIRIIICTNAFGMGINKPDVRFVIHADLPDTLEAYFQEAGRGGRDGKEAIAYCLYHDQDIKKLETRIETRYPPIEEIKKVYDKLFNQQEIAYGEGADLCIDFSIANFASYAKMQLQVIHSSLILLQQEGYLEFTENLNTPSKLIFLVDREALYKFQIQNQKFESFIKLLLRSYSGLFTQYTGINEDQLARIANTSRDVIYEYLKKLSSLGIIQYIPAKKGPMIYFLHNRIPSKDLQIAPAIYRKRKEHYKKKIAHVVHYIKSVSKCRSQLLLDYFDDKHSQRCGSCDNCQTRNIINLSQYEFDMVAVKLKEILQNPHFIEDIPDKINLSKHRTLKVIKYLLDTEKIINTEDNRIVWNR